MFTADTLLIAAAGVGAAYTFVQQQWYAYAGDDTDDGGDDEGDGGELVTEDA